MGNVSPLINQKCCAKVSSLIPKTIPDIVERGGIVRIQIRLAWIIREWFAQGQLLFVPMVGVQMRASVDKLYVMVDALILRQT